MNVIMLLTIYCSIHSSRNDISFVSHKNTVISTHLKELYFEIDIKVLKSLTKNGINLLKA